MTQIMQCFSLVMTHELLARLAKISCVLGGQKGPLCLTTTMSFPIGAEHVCPKDQHGHDLGHTQT